MSDGYRIVIPARFGSSRLPGKPLCDIQGKPLLQYVVERAQASCARQIVVATDDQRIMARMQALGVDCCMTSSCHQSGTDRIVEVCEHYGWGHDDLIVNLQGDEPDMPAALLDQVAQDIQTHGDASMATIAQQCQDAQQVLDPNIVKVVLNDSGYALYFSRAPIPWNREATTGSQLDGQRLIPAHYLRHIGLYAYRVGFLREFTHWPVHPLEEAERLEQLRALGYGKKIHVALGCAEPGHGIDTPEDLQRFAAQVFNRKSHNVT